MATEEHITKHKIEEKFYDAISTASGIVELLKLSAYEIDGHVDNETITGVVKALRRSLDDIESTFEEALKQCS